MTELANEWRCLQQQFEEYEKWSLWIKLLNVVLTLYLLVSPMAMAIFLVAVLYVQDAIVKTMQSRTGQRLVAIEHLIGQGNTGSAYQLHSQWAAKRAGMAGLIVEYVRHCLKPTVMFPHLVLLLVLLTQFL